MLNIRLQWLQAVVWVEVGLAALGIAAILGRSLLRGWTHRRDAALLRRGLDTIFQLLGGGQLQTAAQRLRRLPFRIQLAALDEFRRTVSGREGASVAALADAAGVPHRGRRLADHPIWHRRLLGLRALALGSTESGSLLADLLEDPDAAVRGAAASLAADHPAPEVVGALIRRLDEDDSSTRFAVLEALVRCGPQAADLIVSWLHDGSPTEAAAYGLMVLGRIGDPRALALAMQLTTHRQPAVRREAAHVIGLLGEEIAQGALARLLADPEPEVRRAACMSVGQLHWTHLGAAVAACLADADFAVRRQAGYALRRLGAPGETLLMDTLWQKDPYAADMARHVLDLPLPTVEDEASV